MILFVGKTGTSMGHRYRIGNFDSIFEYLA